MHQPAVFIRRAVLRFAGTTSVRCRPFSSIPILSSKQRHLSSQTLLRTVSSSSSSSSLGPATASLSTVTADATATRNDKDTDAGAGADVCSSSVIYVGPLTQTFRRLKIFSLSSLALASSLSPLIFIVESSLPSTARAALATTALATSGVSTALVAWCGRPYVTTLRNLATTSTCTNTCTSASSPSPPSNSTSEAQKRLQEQEQTTAHSHSHNENVPAGIEMTTLTLTLSSLTTRVYDPAFLCDTTRAFARWELARSVQLPPEDAVSVRPGSEETVAETMDGAGNVLGRWIVTWGENGEGSCRAEGRVET
jgi:hypothetical protein